VEDDRNREGVETQQQTREAVAKALSGQLSEEVAANEAIKTLC